ncbi:hypothetical protein FA95DRAFT_1561203 [Auriscalpium vulgare]|uniref:Uncharacterized protein n=1 Tax=Auriscalpium vulgare TaxID=40419 RepID=A0ACB8RML2_9AGAM|nr:hypothetical protein FA95DRAFT_1561203 [Auriscalpium vulgare]
MRPAESRQRTATHKNGDFRGATALTMLEDERPIAAGSRAEAAQRRLFAAVILFCETNASKIWRRQEIGSRSVCGTVRFVRPPAHLSCARHMCGLSSSSGRAGAE